MDYKEYICSKEWKRKRRELIAQSNGICEHTKSPAKRFQVHHKSYENLGHESEAELSVVSEKSHKQIHRRNKNAFTKTKERRKTDRIY